MHDKRCPRILHVLEHVDLLHSVLFMLRHVHPRKGDVLHQSPLVCQHDFLEMKVILFERKVRNNKFPFQILYEHIRCLNTLIRIYMAEYIHYLYAYASTQTHNFHQKSLDILSVDVMLKLALLKFINTCKSLPSKTVERRWSLMFSLAVPTRVNPTLCFESFNKDHEESTGRDLNHVHVWRRRL